MKITNMKINHLTDPLGFELSNPRVSFHVEETGGKYAAKVQIQAALDEAFSDIVYDSGELAGADLLGIPLEMELKPRTAYYWRAFVTADNGDYAVSGPAYFETSKMREPWEAKWIGSESIGKVNPVFEKEFTTDRNMAKARIYSVGLGLYEIYLDGKKVGDEYLAPGCTDYNRWIQYQTYAVDIKAGTHKLEVLVGDGWYKGEFGFNKAAEFYGDQASLLLELVMTDACGAESRVATDESWTVRESDIISASIYDGETYAPGRADGKSGPANVICACEEEIVSTEPCCSEKKQCAEPAEECGSEKADSGKIDSLYARLAPRYSLPVKTHQTFSPEIIKTPAGETVLDFGQNMAGFVKFYADEPAGTVIRLQYGEILQDGNFYNGNLVPAKEEYTYISDGKARELRPHFTYYGFRYVKVEGFTKEISPEQFTACSLYSDLDLTISFETDHEKVNQLVSNTLWGQRSNYVDVPTDCPQRAERMGWTADAQVFSGTACYNMDSYAFLRKYCRDMYETQKELGHMTHVVPAFSENGETCSVWGDAATVIPWNLYQFYGDKTILQEQFDSMKRWVDSIVAIDESTGGRRMWDVGFHFGDWLALDQENNDMFKGGTEDGYIATAYYYQSADIVAKAAAVLGLKEEEETYRKLAGEIREALKKEYLTPNGRLAITTQTGYAVALYMDFVPEEMKPRLGDFLEAKLKVNDGYLKTGFVGTYLLNRVLSDNGHNEMAYKLLLNEEYPSWLYEINMGATTVWERWNSVMPDGHMNPTNMNSLNHYSYGSVCEWMYRNMAGLKPVEDCPGFKKAVIAPQPDYRIRKCDLSYRSAAGTYKVAWSVKDDGSFLMDVTVPFGCEARIVFPNTSTPDEAATAGEYHYHYMPETPILKVYSVTMQLREVVENPAARAALESFVESWRHIPQPMWEMSVELLNTLPMSNFNLDEERLAALDAKLREC